MIRISVFVVVVSVVSSVLIVAHRHQPIVLAGPLDVTASLASSTVPAIYEPRAFLHLEMRDHVIAIMPGDRYSVFSRDGRVIARDVSLDDLKRIDSTAHGLIDTGVARQGFVLDSRVDYRSFAATKTVESSGTSTDQ